MSWIQRSLDTLLRPLGYETMALESQDYKSLLYDTAWADGGRATAAGVNIGPESALRISAVHACTSILAGAVGSLPLKIFRRTGDDLSDKEEVRGDARGYMLSRKTNPWQTAVTHRGQSMTKLTSGGNAYAVEVRVRNKISELWPIEPQRIEIRQMTSGSLRYKVRPDSSSPVATRGKEYNQEEILHLRGLSTNGISGRGVIADARETFGLGAAQERFGARLYGSGAQFSGHLEHPGKLTPKARESIENSFAKMKAGLNNSWKMLLLQEGMKFEKSSMSAEDAQFLEARKFQLEDIARFFNMPPSMIGSTAALPRSNVEEDTRRFLAFTLTPWLVNLEAQYNADIFDPVREQDLFVEHNVAGLLRGNLKARYAAYMQARQGGWLSVNEIRRFENMNRIEGGDEYLAPLNMAPTSGDRDTDQEEEQKSREADA